MNTPLSQSLRVVNEPYTYIPAGQIGEIKLVNIETNETFVAKVKAIEVKNVMHQCAIHHCDLKTLASCSGCRCMAGGRKDGKAVVFELIEFKSE